MSKSTHRIFNLSIIASSTYIVRNTINEEIKEDAKLLGACYKSGSLGEVVKETDCGTLIFFFAFDKLVSAREMYLTRGCHRQS